MLRNPPSLHQASSGLGVTRTRLSPKAGMRGPSQGQGAFTPLSQLTLGYRGSRVRVRVSRVWVASNPKTGREYGLRCLLIDAEGVSIQACARPQDMNRLKDQLVEGKVYALSEFIVREKQENYMACSNGLVINMGAQTKVDEITDHAGSSIPLHSFEFVDFGDLPSRNNDRSLLTDVIGQIVSIEDEGQTWKWDGLRTISFCNIHLCDLGGRQLNVTLYEDLGRNFKAEKVFKQDRKVPVVAIFAGMLVEHYNGLIYALSYFFNCIILSFLCFSDLISPSCYLEIGFIVRSTSASKYYLDLDVEEVQKFRASLDGPQKPIDCLPCRFQKPVKPTELVDSWRTIKQLKSLNADADADELQRTWLCRATLKGIDCNKGWSYQSCFHCRGSIIFYGSKFLCIKGCPSNMLPVQRYKLHAVMEDDTDSMNVIIFDDAAQKTVGCSVEDLNREVTGYGISAVISSQQGRTFVVTLRNDCFVVKHVLNDDEQQLLDSDDRSDLTQNEDSYASHGSSSQVKKEKMVIKEEMEADVGGEEPEVESSSASCRPSPLKNVKKEDMAIEEEKEPKRQKIAKGNETWQTDSECPISPANLSSQKVCTWSNRSSNSSLQ